MAICHVFDLDMEVWFDVKMKFWGTYPQWQPPLIAFFSVLLVAISSVICKWRRCDSIFQNAES